MTKKVLSEAFTEPLNGTTMASVDINVGDGNLTIDRIRSDAQLLAKGTLQYYEKRGCPIRAQVQRDGKVTLTLRGDAARHPRLNFPWSACNGAITWHIHLNPTVTSDIVAHSDGGNVKLDLTGMAVTRVDADTAGGNVDVILRDGAAGLSVTATTGAGFVAVFVPNELAARIRATTRMGKVTIDPRFTRIADDIYQSSDFDGAATGVEMTLRSGAGTVSVTSLSCEEWLELQGEMR